MSRKVASALFSSVDGIVDEPYKFQYDSFDERLGELMESTIESATDVVMGRTTYQEWSGYWPTDAAPPEDGGFKDFINGVTKHVASRTLGQDDLTWQNSRHIDGDLADHVRALKETDGGTVAVTGSISVVQQLLKAGVLDELVLMVHPAVHGSGRRLFDDFEPTRLELAAGETTPSGNAVLTYRLRQD